MWLIVVLMCVCDAFLPVTPMASRRANVQSRDVYIPLQNYSFYHTSRLVRFFSEMPWGPVLYRRYWDFSPIYNIVSPRKNLQRERHPALYCRARRVKYAPSTRRRRRCCHRLLVVVEMGIPVRANHRTVVLIIYRPEEKETADPQPASANHHRRLLLIKEEGIFVLSNDCRWNSCSIQIVPISRLSTLAPQTISPRLKLQRAVVLG